MKILIINNLNNNKIRIKVAALRGIRKTKEIRIVLINHNTEILSKKIPNKKFSKNHRSFK